jgi:hypothetical protein
MRGKLRSGYKYGAISRGAEKIILRAVAAEIAADQMEEDTHIQMAAMPVMSPASRRSLVEGVHRTSRQSARLRRMLLTADPEHDKRHSIDSIVQVFYALEKAGIIKDSVTEDGS